MEDHTEENRTVVRSGKSEAEVTNNRRLRSTYCGMAREECCLFDVRQWGSLYYHSSLSSGLACMLLVAWLPSSGVIGWLGCELSVTVRAVLIVPHPPSCNSTRCT